MDFLNRFYLCLGGNKLFLEFSFEIGPGTICNWGSSQGGGQVVTGPISGGGSHLEVCEGGHHLLTFTGIYHIIEGVIIFEGIPERFCLCWVSIKGVWCCSDGLWCCSHTCCMWVWYWWWISSGWWRRCFLYWGQYLNCCW